MIDREHMAMVDLHMYSCESYGVDKIHDLVEKVCLAGIKIFSITDTYDNIMASDNVKYLEQHNKNDIIYIRGIEFPCSSEAGKCCIIGYGMNTCVRDFGRIVETGRRRFEQYMKGLVEFLSSRYGLEITECKKWVLYNSGHYGLSELENILVTVGLAKNSVEANEKYISQYKCADECLPAKDVIEAILSTGGIPVWGHPFGTIHDSHPSGQKIENQLQALLRMGLMGMECYYSEYDKKQVECLLAIAKRHHLLISGGSGYRGMADRTAPGMLNAYGEMVKMEELTILSELEKRQREQPFPIIEIDEWHNYGGYFWIMPIKVKDLEQNAISLDNQECMKEVEISIPEDAFMDFLYPIFKKYFDKELPENKARWEEYPSDPQLRYIDWFEWNLTDNFYTYGVIEEILAYIEEISTILKTDYYDHRLDPLRNGFRNLPGYLPKYHSRNVTLSEEETDKLVADNRKHILDFYGRFVASLRDMVKVGDLDGYKLISVCGP